MKGAEDLREARRGDSGGLSEHEPGQHPAKIPHPSQWKILSRVEEPAGLSGLREPLPRLLARGGEEGAPGGLGPPCGAGLCRQALGKAGPFEPIERGCVTMEGQRRPL